MLRLRKGSVAQTAAQVLQSPEPVILQCTATPSHPGPRSMSNFAASRLVFYISAVSCIKMSTETERRPETLSAGFAKGCSLDCYCSSHGNVYMWEIFVLQSTQIAASADYDAYCRGHVIVCCGHDELWHQWPLVTIPLCYLHFVSFNIWKSQEAGVILSGGGKENTSKPRSKQGNRNCQ